MVERWRDRMALRGTYADSAFLLLAADLFAVVITVLLVDEAGRRVQEHPVEFPPGRGRPPVALVTLAAVVDTLIVAVIELKAEPSGGPPPGVAAAARDGGARPPSPTSDQSTEA